MEGCILYQTYSDELERSMRSGVGLSSWSEAGLGSWATERLVSECKMVKVHDYKDKFVLDHLMHGARDENPGFRKYDHGRHAAVLAWCEMGNGLVPVGYWISTVQHPARSYLERKSYWYPDTLAQVYVVKEARRKGVATALLRNYSFYHPGSIWVESPRWETRAILTHLGFEETDQRYETWQMMEGLTKWTPRSEAH